VIAATAAASLLGSRSFWSGNESKGCECGDRDQRKGMTGPPLMPRAEELHLTPMLFGRYPSKSFSECWVAVDGAGNRCWGRAAA